MSNTPSRNRAFMIAGLGIALLIAIFVSPFASSDPDGLNRVAEDLKFADQEDVAAPAKKLPFAAILDGYALKGVPDEVATPLAGVVGTLAAFGLAWGISKLLVRNSASSNRDRPTSSSEHDLDKR